jgi:hypothetical protein
MEAPWDRTSPHPMRHATFAPSRAWVILPATGNVGRWFTVLPSSPRAGSSTLAGRRSASRRRARTGPRQGSPRSPTFALQAQSHTRTLHPVFGQLDPTTQEGTQQPESRTLWVQLLRRKKVNKIIDRIGARRSREDGDLASVQHQRWEPAAEGIGIVTDLNAWLASAAWCG